MKLRALWLWIPWGLFATAALGWVIYWHVVAGTAEARVAAFVRDQNAKGAQASIARVVRHGFPALLRLELHGVAFAPARGGWRITTERTDLNIALLRPEHVVLEAKAPIAVTRADGAVTTIEARALIASLRTRGSALARAGIEADDLSLDDPRREGVLRVRKFVANLRPDARAAGDYQLAFEALDLALPRPVRSFEAFGVDVAKLRAAIVVEHGATLLQGDEGDPTAPWRSAGGQMRFEAIDLNWGPIETRGSGAGGLDSERRLNGTLTLPIDRPGPIFAALANGANANESTRRALGMLATSFNATGKSITLDVEAANGVLRLEGIGVRLLPPVY
ncbi:MAG: DUF2125 domain-containing protein [Terricaulis sp.]